MEFTNILKSYAKINDEVGENDEVAIDHCELIEELRRELWASTLSWEWPRPRWCAIKRPPVQTFDMFSGCSESELQMLSDLFCRTSRLFLASSMKLRWLSAERVVPGYDSVVLSLLDRPLSQYYWVCFGYPVGTRSVGRLLWSLTCEVLNWDSWWAIEFAKNRKSSCTA